MPDDAGNQITVWSIVRPLAGTIISAIVSYLLQRRSFSEARQQKE
jgi:phosphate/sulfate permease